MTVSFGLVYATESKPATGEGQPEQSPDRPAPKEIELNSSEQIQRNNTVTFLPAFEGAEVFRRGRSVVVKTLERDIELEIPISMCSALVDAINKAME